MELAAFATKGCEESGADQEKVEEVIEVPSLEGGVLAIVGEAEELAEVRCGVLGDRCREMLPQHGQCEHRRGRGSTFTGEAGEAVDVAAMRLMLVPAGEAEAKLARDEPEASAAIAVPTGIDRFRQRLSAPVVLFHSITRGRLLQPRIRQVLQSALKILTCPYRHEEAKAALLVVVSHVVDFAWCEMGR